MVKRTFSTHSASSARWQSAGALAMVAGRCVRAWPRTGTIGLIAATRCSPAILPDGKQVLGHRNPLPPACPRLYVGTSRGLLIFMKTIYSGVTLVYARSSFLFFSDIHYSPAGIYIFPADVSLEAGAFGGDSLRFSIARTYGHRSYGNQRQVHDSRDTPRTFYRRGF